MRCSSRCSCGSYEKKYYGWAPQHKTMIMMLRGLRFFKRLREKVNNLLFFVGKFLETLNLIMHITKFKMVDILVATFSGCNFFLVELVITNEFFWFGVTSKIGSIVSQVWNLLGYAWIKVGFICIIWWLMSILSVIFLIKNFFRTI